MILELDPIYNVKKIKRKKTMATTEKQIIRALEASGGFQSQAARGLKISPAALSGRIKRNKKLQVALADIQEEHLDLAESQLISAIWDREPWAICFFLKCRGKVRGYSEKPRTSESDSDVKSIEFKFEVIDGRKATTG